MQDIPIQQTLIIYGCGGHSRSIADVALTIGYLKLVFIDNNARPNEEIFGFPVLQMLPSHLESSPHPTLIAVGNNHNRAELYQQLLNLDSLIVTLISPQAYIGKQSSIGRGSSILHGAHLGPQARIGENCIINTKCIIEHEVAVGDHTHVAIHATLAGRSKIGNYVTIGANATVIDGIEICDQVTIGAGAVVIDNIDEPGTYVGIPARKLQNKHESRS